MRKIETLNKGELKSAIKLEWEQDEVEYSSNKNTSYTIGVW